RPDDPLSRSIGESIWPEWLSQQMLEQERTSQGPRNWTSLYQQRPTPDEGGYFQRKWFKYYDFLPEHLRIYGASDFAVSEKHGDYTVHLVAGVDPIGDIYLLDLWRSQSHALDWVETLFAITQRYRDRLHIWTSEEDQIARAVGPFIAKFARERQQYFTLYALKVAGDKKAQTRSIQARVQQGCVIFPRNAAWLAEFEAELLQFPAGKHDDQVDALGMLGRCLDKHRAATVPKQPEPARTITIAVPGALPVTRVNL